MAFHVYFNKQNEQDPVWIFQHNKGQVDLDYSLWTTDSVFLLEAKLSNNTFYDEYLMIGWHKFAYAAARFKEKDYNGLNIYPVYFLRTPNKVILFVFPKFLFYKDHKGDGVILNDVNQTPECTYIINMKNYS